MRGFRGALATTASLGSPRPRCQRRLPERASRRGPAAPWGRMRGQPGPQRSGPPARAGAENHTPARRPDACVPSPPSAPASPGRDRLVGLAHLNLDRPGEQALLLPKRLSRALGRRRGGASARGGSCSRSAWLCFRALPRNRGDLRASPHPVGSSPPSRPALSAARPFLAGAGSEAEPGGTIPPSWLCHPLRPAPSLDGQTY